MDAGDIELIFDPNEAKAEIERLNRILDFVERHDPETHRRAVVHERINRDAAIKDKEQS